MGISGHGDCGEVLILQLSWGDVLQVNWLRMGGQIGTVMVGWERLGLLVWLNDSELVAKYRGTG